ncbi:MAG: hypothetical protein IPJ98_31705 [Bryobacterales bacterium]|nr:hypothetical protein [Bryobacterales bacterium]
MAVDQVKLIRMLKRLGAVAQALGDLRIGAWILFATPVPTVRHGASPA